MPRRPLMVRAALLRRSCDGVGTATESLLRLSCADQLRRADEQGGQKISTASETTLGASKTAGKAAGARQDVSEGRPKPKWLKM